MEDEEGKIIPDHPILKKFENGPPPEREYNPTRWEIALKWKEDWLVEEYEKIKEIKWNWDPNKELEKKETSTTDPWKTIFVGRLNFKTTEQTLKSAFEKYGTVVKATIVKNGEKSWGYGFVEYKHWEDASEAYKRANGIWIDDKKVLVDKERGRTDKEFLPWWLGAGIGRGRYNEEEEKKIKTILWRHKDATEGLWKRDIKAEVKREELEFPKSPY